MSEEEKTVTLKLESPHDKDTIEVSKELWKRFEQRAKELETPVEKLFLIALDDFLKARGF